MAEAKKTSSSKTTKETTEEEKTNSSDAEVQAEAATGRAPGEVQSGILGGPSQDDLNPAYAAPKDENNPKDESPNQVDPDPPN
jgi:hypothetical protein